MWQWGAGGRNYLEKCNDTLSKQITLSTTKTLWHIFRSNLLWTICQYCKYHLWSDCFHVGVALFCSWKLTVEVGIGVWLQLQKRTVEKHSAMETHYLDIWSKGDIVCAKSKVEQWHRIRHHITNSCLRAEHSTRINRATIVAFVGEQYNYLCILNQTEKVPRPLPLKLGRPTRPLSVASWIRGGDFGTAHGLTNRPHMS